MYEIGTTVAILFGIVGVLVGQGPGGFVGAIVGVVLGLIVDGFHERGRSAQLGQLEKLRNEPHHTRSAARG